MPSDKPNGHNPAVAAAVSDALPGPSQLILPTELVMQNQRDSLYKAREKKVVEAICRSTGRTDYETNNIQDLARECEVEEIFYKRGTWHEAGKGYTLFKWDGKDMLLFGPIQNLQGTLVQSCEELYDKRALRATHHTKEDERG